MIVYPRYFAVSVCAIAGTLTSGCAVKMPSFALPGSGTPSASYSGTSAPRGDLKPKAPLPESQRLGADMAGAVPYVAPPPLLVAKPGEKIISVTAEDTLLSLSRAHGVPVTMLMSTNNLSNLTLAQGQQLRIPALGPKR